MDAGPVPTDTACDALSAGFEISIRTMPLEELTLVAEELGPVPADPD